MSYNIYVERPACAHCGRGPDDVVSVNITRNVSRIADACLVKGGATAGKVRADETFSWWRLDGWSAAEALPIISAAHSESHNPERDKDFAAWEPSNGWGSRLNVCEALDQLETACKDNPGAVIRVSG